MILFLNQQKMLITLKIKIIQKVIENLLKIIILV